MEELTERLSLDAFINVKKILKNKRENISVSILNMPVTYDLLTGDSFETIDYTNTAPNTSLYPDSNAVTILPQIWAPRIYGKDLTAFEIASSGKLAISLMDIHTLDVTRSNYGNASYFKNTMVSQSNYSFEFLANQTDLQIMMDALSNNINITAASNVNITARDGDMSLTASNNLNVSVSNNFSVNTLSNINVTSVEGSLSMNTFSNVSVIAREGTFNLSADSNVMTIFSRSNMTIYSSNDLSATSVSNLSLTSTQGSIDLIAFSNASFISQKGTFELSADSNTLSIFSLSNMSVYSSNDLLVTSVSNASLQSTQGSIDLLAFSNASFISQEGTFELSANSNTLSIFSRSNMTIYSSNDLTMDVLSNINVTSYYGNILTYASSNIKFAADGSNVYLNLLVPEDTIQGFAISNIEFQASCNLNLTSLCNMNLTASNINLLVNYDFNLVASNNVTISTSNNLNMNFNNIFLQGNGDIAMTAQSNVKFYISSTSNDPASPIFNIKGDAVEIRGDLLITGSINTSNIFNTTVIQESLKITDKTIVLATSGSNFNLNDGPFDSVITNGGSGIEVDGIPSTWSGYNSNLQAAAEKSIKWEYNTTGVEGLMTAGGLSNESAWVVRGGALHLKSQKIVDGNIHEITFGFRVNELDELELIKTWYDSNASQITTKRVARFGRILV